MVDEIIALNYSVRLIVFSSDSCLLDFISCLFDSIVDCMMMNCSSGLLSIVL